MIYMVDHVFADAPTEPEWHAWYSAYLRKLVAVPGIHSAQRFKAIGCAPSRYLAMYTVESAAVFTSDAYKQMGGGGSQSARFHSAYRLWTRNLFVAARANDPQEAASIRAPAVDVGEQVVVFDRSECVVSSDVEAQATWLEAVGLHMTTKFRAFSIVSRESAAQASASGFIYEPFTPVIS